MTAQEMATTNPVEVVLNMALGYLVSRSLHVATEMRIADLLKDGPKTIEELAARTAAQPQSLQRLLRALAAQGIFAEDEQGRFMNTPASALLQQGVMRDGVLLCGEVTGDGSWWNAVGALRHSIMTGEAAFARQHGMGFFDYVSQHPECNEWFDRGWRISLRRKIPRLPVRMLTRVSLTSLTLAAGKADCSRKFSSCIRQYAARCSIFRK